MYRFVHNTSLYCSVYSECSIICPVMSLTSLLEPNHNMFSHVLIHCSVRSAASSTTKVSKLVGRRRKHLLQLSGSNNSNSTNSNDTNRIPKLSSLMSLVGNEKAMGVSDVCPMSEGCDSSAYTQGNTSKSNSTLTYAKLTNHKTPVKAYDVIAQKALFAEHRERIISNLETNKNDKSLAGGVDKAIRPLVTLINSSSRFVTQSSCSGRFSVYHRVVKKKTHYSGDTQRNNSDSNQSEHSTTSTDTDIITVKRKRGLGIGTVYDSHDVFDMRDIPVIANKIAKRIAIDYRLPFYINSNAKARNFDKSMASQPFLDRNNILEESLQIKFEPTILHVMCRSFGDAHRLLAAAVQGGHRRSGIVISPMGKHTNNSGKREHRGGTSKSITPTEESIITAQQDNMLDDTLGWKISVQIQSSLGIDAVLYMAPAMGDETLVPFIKDTSTTVVMPGRKNGQAKATQTTLMPSSEMGPEVSDELVAVLERMMRMGNQLFIDNISRRDKFVALLHSRGVLKLTDTTEKA